jgi:hypothetical protein
MTPILIYLFICSKTELSFTTVPGRLARPRTTSLPGIALITLITAHLLFSLFTHLKTGLSFLKTTPGSNKRSVSIPSRGMKSFKAAGGSSSNILLWFAFALLWARQLSLASSFVGSRECDFLKGREKQQLPRTPARPWRDLRGGTKNAATSIPPKTVAFLILNPAVGSVVAGSIAGAIGVGVAFPLDTLKTKAQVLGQQIFDTTTLDTTAVGGTADASQKSNPSMFQIISYVYNTEGVSGFYGGVRGMMFGQAIIKALAFSTNSNALAALRSMNHEPANSSLSFLLIAACFSGFVTSFVVAPIERIKVMMQATSSGVYKNELDCLTAILRTEGWKGFMGRGLGATLAREIPSYGIYFCIYGVLMSTSIATLLGPVAPLLFGAFSGMASWLPVYPIDVVKVGCLNVKVAGLMYHSIAHPYCPFSLRWLVLDVATKHRGRLRRVCVADFPRVVR